MNVKVFTAIPTGYSGQLIEVEGTTNKGLPSFNLVGMGDKTILESRERVRSAIMNSDFSFPKHKITINLAPADLIKSGSSLDLPIAINILILAKQLREDDIKRLFFTGELSLDGSLKPVKGILNIIETAKNHGFKHFFFPPLPPPNPPLSKVSKSTPYAPLSSYSFILNTKVRSRHLAVQVKFPFQTSRQFQKRTLAPPPFLPLTLLSALLTKFKVSILPSAPSFLLLPDIIIYSFLGHQVVVKLYSRVQPKIFFRHLAPPNLSQFTKFTVSPPNLIKFLKNAPFVSLTIAALPVL